MIIMSTNDFIYLRQSSRSRCALRLQRADPLRPISCGPAWIFPGCEPSGKNTYKVVLQLMDVLHAGRHELSKDHQET